MITCTWKTFPAGGARCNHMPTSTPKSRMCVEQACQTATYIISTQAVIVRIGTFMEGTTVQWSKGLSVQVFQKALVSAYTSWGVRMTHKHGSSPVQYTIQWTDGCHPAFAVPSLPAASVIIASTQHHPRASHTMNVF